MPEGARADIRPKLQAWFLFTAVAGMPAVLWIAVQLLGFDTPRVGALLLFVVLAWWAVALHLWDVSKPFLYARGRRLWGIRLSMLLVVAIVPWWVYLRSPKRVVERPPGVAKITSVHLLPPDSKTHLGFVNRLFELHATGQALLARAETAGQAEFEAEARAWADELLKLLVASGTSSEALLMNSDIGTVMPKLPPSIPRRNRLWYYNVRFRMERLQQIIPEKEKELRQRKDLILIPETPATK